MEDAAIIDLYWDRQERAIVQTQYKYGAYCHAIARGIVGGGADAEECVNDTYLGAWNAMPSERPALLKAFLGKICRNLSLKRWRLLSAQKRGGGEVPLALEELAECVPGGESAEAELIRRTESAELVGALNAFLAGLPSERRRMFMRRYWYCDSISDISGRFDCGESKVKMTLKRVRDDLASYLEREGIVL